MTRAELQAFTSRFLQTWERGDVRALAACYTEHATLDSPMFQKISGRERIESSYVDLFKIFDKWRFAVDETIIDTDADRVVVLATSEATHVGRVFGHAGSGRRFNVRTTVFCQFSEGLIAGEIRLYDFTGLLVQLGVLKAKGS